MKEPSLKQEFDFIKIYFGDVLHLCLKLSDFVGLQSWRTTDVHYYIEYTMRTGTITSEYDDPDKFAKILKLLDEAL